MLTARLDTTLRRSVTMCDFQARTWAASCCRGKRQAQYVRIAAREEAAYDKRLRTDWGREKAFLTWRCSRMSPLGRRHSPSAFELPNNEKCLPSFDQQFLVWLSQDFFFTTQYWPPDGHGAAQSELEIWLSLSIFISIWYGPLPTSIICQCRAPYDHDPAVV